MAPTSKYDTWNLSERPIRDIMIKDVVCVEQGTSLQKAARLMLSHRVGCLVVMDNNVPVGIVTERNFIRLICEAEPIGKWLIVDDIMPVKLLTVTPSTSISKAFSLFNTHSIKRLPVVSNKRLKGLLTMRQMLIVSRDHLLNMLIKNRVLAKEINRDELTGLFNKRFLMNYLKYEFERSREYGARACVAFFDIDSFKAINDNYSHSAGDYVLKNIGKIMRKYTRSHDVVARFGGEEFVVVFPSTKAFEAAYLANKLRENIEAYPFQYQRKKLKITVSAGVAPFTSAKGINKILELADEALYLAKANGKNQVFRWSETAGKLIHAPFTER